MFLFLCFSFSVLAFSQNIQSDIDSQFRDFSSLIENKNFGKALDIFGNEDFLKIFPKEQMIALMDQMFNSKDFDLKIHQPENLIVSTDIIKDKNNTFVKLSYKQNLEMKFNMPGIKSGQLLSALKAEFGDGQVDYNESTGFFEVRTIKDAVANSSDLKNWKFTIIEKKQIPILKQFIPESFLRSLN
ncbi:hypothetical protein QGN23_05095 [Chryseobacterium gotjawalense]|uniref:DUF4252 domain-containing protein n=1 Tax=Chryseobacterium gotjawalense TaxID=3042315 RepID=A0ABY8RFT4_9FLAO|nr:hypothetical protein [Chryseobacterium sp. wdc7]WHF52656.1 hypothetical protein QGN23_05095 [Chryseobacterium sp. wdc7]